VSNFFNGQKKNSWKFLGVIFTQKCHFANFVWQSLSSKVFLGPKAFSVLGIFFRVFFSKFRRSNLAFDPGFPWIISLESDNADVYNY